MAHATAQPSGQTIATTGTHTPAARTRPLSSTHCESPTATPVTRPVMSRDPIPVPAPVSTAPTPSPIATPKAVAKIHSGPTLRYLRSINHWAAPITAPANAPPSAPDTAPSTGPTAMSANSPPTGKPRKASIHQRKNRQPTTPGPSLAVMIAPRQVFDRGSRITCRVGLRCSVPIGPGKQKEYAGQGEPDRPQDVPDHHDVCGCFEPGRFEGPDEYAGSRDQPEEPEPPPETPKERR